MKLKDIAKQVLAEDTWGNNPASGGSMPPGKTPNAVSPKPTGNPQMYNVQTEFQSFENTLNREEDSATKTLKTNVGQKLNNKKILARASKGSVGQDQDYEIDVVGVDVHNIGEEYYVVLNGADKKDYYLDTGHQIKVLGSSKKKDSQTSTTQPPNQPGATSQGHIGGIKYPKNMGIGGTRPGA